MTVALALVRGVRALKTAQVPDAANDARILLAFALSIDRARLALVLPDEMPFAVQQRYDQAIGKRVQLQPISQIVGKRAFYGRDFRVSRDVLDPRPDTELLIETALTQDFNTVLDLGTGSGCILITLLAENLHATGVGADISEAALEIAQANADLLSTNPRIGFVLSDWFSGIADQTFDLIVSNPPYISADEMQNLDPDVQNWEPEIALTSGGDGLESYRTLIRNAPKFMNSGGRLIVEIGYKQGQSVRNMFEQSGFAKIEIFKDINGKNRVISGIWR